MYRFWFAETKGKKNDKVKITINNLGELNSRI